MYAILRFQKKTSGKLLNTQKESVRSERRTVEQMSDYNRDANDTIREQTMEIGRLMDQNRRYRKLLDRIPPDVMQQIQNYNRNKEVAR